MFDGKATSKRNVSLVGSKGLKASFVSASDAKKLREQREFDRKRNAGVLGI